MPSTAGEWESHENTILAASRGCCGRLASQFDPSSGPGLDANHHADKSLALGRFSGERQQTGRSGERVFQWSNVFIH
jgi:hypothetical protein